MLPNAILVLFLFEVLDMVNTYKKVLDVWIWDMINDNDPKIYISTSSIAEFMFYSLEFKEIYMGQ